MFLCLLFSIRGVRAYLRTGLKGELIRGVGIGILMISFLGEDITLLIIGVVISSIGWLILATFESELCQEIYGKATLYKRIIGDFPNLLNDKAYQKALKATGVTAGVLCLLTAFEYYISSKTISSVEVVNIGFLILAGILFLCYYLLKKV